MSAPCCQKFCSIAFEDSVKVMYQYLKSLSHDERQKFLRMYITDHVDVTQNRDSAKRTIPCHYHYGDPRVPACEDYFKWALQVTKKQIFHFLEDDSHCEDRSLKLHQESESEWLKDNDLNSMLLLSEAIGSSANAQMYLDRAHCLASMGKTALVTKDFCKP